MARKLKTYQTSLGFRSGGSGTIDEGGSGGLGPPTATSSTRVRRCKARIPTLSRRPWWRRASF
jgi:hypothetical protein